jgi:hypothetical protein
MSKSSPRVGSRTASLTVPCHVSDRWLRFEEREQFEVLDEDLIQVDVMTRDDDDEPYKLCELVVARGDLLRAIAAYGDPPFRTAPVRKTAAPEPAPPRKGRRTARGGSDQPALTDQ